MRRPGQQVERGKCPNPGGGEWKQVTAARGAGALVGHPSRAAGRGPVNSDFLPCLLFHCAPRPPHLGCRPHPTDTKGRRGPFRRRVLLRMSPSLFPRRRRGQRGQMGLPLAWRPRAACYPPAFPPFLVKCLSAALWAQRGYHALGLFSPGSERGRYREGTPGGTFSALAALTHGHGKECL